MKKITLPAEARARLARQIADTTGVVTVCGSSRSAPGAPIAHARS
nr:hypothetical protein [uncultured Sphingomonas sp.]